MDILSLFKGYGFDIGSVAAIVVLTGTIKTYFRMKQRYIPLIPVILGFIFGVLNFVIGDLSGMAWYQIAGHVFKEGFVYAGISAIVFKLYKTTILNK